MVGSLMYMCMVALYSWVPPYVAALRLCAI